ncbi:MAG TPA: hypothetical protein VIL20_25935 [Sandaracinaceae bacterium]
MPYRDELEALRARAASLERELERARSQLERARAALASAVADLAGLPPEADIPWRSLHGGEPVMVRFVNRTARKLELVWIGYDGRPHSIVTIVPGGEREERTYVAHLFRLLDAATGEIVLQRYVRAGETRIIAR